MNIFSTFIFPLRRVNIIICHSTDNFYLNFLLYSGNSVQRSKARFVNVYHYFFDLKKKENSVKKTNKKL